MKKILHAIISVVLATVILVAGTWAYQVFRNFPCDLTIIEGITDIEVYSDEACTVPISVAVHFGQVKRGQTVIFEMWAKNIGVEPVFLVVSVSGDTTWGTVSIFPSISVPLDGGDIQPYILTIVVPPQAGLGAQGFAIQFYEE